MESAIGALFVAAIGGLATLAYKDKKTFTRVYIAVGAALAFGNALLVCWMICITQVNVSLLPLNGECSLAAGKIVTGLQVPGVYVLFSCVIAPIVLVFLYWLSEMVARIKES